MQYMYLNNNTFEYVHVSTHHMYKKETMHIHSTSSQNYMYMYIYVKPHIASTNSLFHIHM